MTAVLLAKIVERRLKRKLRYMRWARQMFGPG